MIERTIKDRMKIILYINMFYKLIDCKIIKILFLENIKQLYVAVDLYENDKSVDDYTELEMLQNIKNNENKNVKEAIFMYELNTLFGMPYVFIAYTECCFISPI